MTLAFAVLALLVLLRLTRAFLTRRSLGKPLGDRLVDVGPQVVPQLVVEPGRRQMPAR